MRLNLLILLCLVSFSSGAQTGKLLKGQNTSVTPEELKLYTLIMDYRKEHNLPDIPLSNELTFVAQTHCLDLVNNKPDTASGCNAHGWSNKGFWSACCYTPDHQQATCMWNKPRELTSYTGNGYEIAFGSSSVSNFVVTAENALQGWKTSHLHNDVILNNDMWKDSKWNAIGVGIYKNFAVVWFGTEIDNSGEPLK